MDMLVFVVAVLAFGYAMYRVGYNDGENDGDVIYGVMHVEYEGKTYEDMRTFANEMTRLADIMAEDATNDAD